ncbi:hypothetical protein ACLK19_08680 [Escherichia coli]
MRRVEMVLTSIDCPTCGRKMALHRTASTWVSGCSGYALPPKSVRTPLTWCRKNQVLNVLEGEDAERNALRANVVARTRTRRWTAISSIRKCKLHVCGITQPATVTRSRGRIPH